MLDYDGCVLSMKPIVDSLVKSAVIKDDSYITTGPWIVLQQFREKNLGPLIAVTVREMT
jgi:hypothetical protein